MVGSSSSSYSRIPGTSGSFHERDWENGIIPEESPSLLISDALGSASSWIPDAPPEGPPQTAILLSEGSLTKSKVDIFYPIAIYSVGHYDVNMRSWGLIYTHYN